MSDPVLPEVTVDQAPTQTTTQIISTEEPKKSVMEYAMQTIELNRMVALGMIIIAIICVVSTLRILHLPGITPDDMSNALNSFKELTLMILSALAGMLTVKK